mmetsp:Transcript_91260/g.263331  ORF Transcript_91260/g.263331 Transcript_91260/m.263331 type:complete len:290 (+) Transcript_91260:628-1497(+)
MLQLSASNIPHHDLVPGLRCYLRAVPRHAQELSNAVLRAQLVQHPVLGDVPDDDEPPRGVREDDGDRGAAQDDAHATRPAILFEKGPPAHNLAGRGVPNDEGGVRAERSQPLLVGEYLRVDDPAGLGTQLSQPVASLRVPNDGNTAAADSDHSLAPREEVHLLSGQRKALQRPRALEAPRIQDDRAVPELLRGQARGPDHGGPRRDQGEDVPYEVQGQGLGGHPLRRVACRLDGGGVVGVSRGLLEQGGPGALGALGAEDEHRQREPPPLPSRRPLARPRHPWAFLSLT